jgi:hypothetical protein
VKDKSFFRYSVTLSLWTEGFNKHHSEKNNVKSIDATGCNTYNSSLERISENSTYKTKKMFFFKHKELHE